MFNTPADNIRKQGFITTFQNLPKGAKFELNGNVWIKRSTRTATGCWPSYLLGWAYVRGNEVVHLDRSGEGGIENETLCRGIMGNS